VAAGDFNGDGAPDLAGANYSSGSVSVLLGNGDGSFRPRVDYADNSFPESVAVGDFDGGGKQDFAVANLDGSSGYPGTAVVLWGNGDGSFLVAPTYQPPRRGGGGLHRRRYRRPGRRLYGVTVPRVRYQMPSPPAARHGEQPQLPVARPGL
jgi:hypothetical protein